jgi:hypothetical protein
MCDALGTVLCFSQYPSRMGREVIPFDLTLDALRLIQAARLAEVNRSTCQHCGRKPTATGRFEYQITMSSKGGAPCPRRLHPARHPVLWRGVHLHNRIREITAMSGVCRWHHWLQCSLGDLSKTLDDEWGCGSLAAWLQDIRNK